MFYRRELAFLNEYPPQADGVNTLEYHVGVRTWIPRSDTLLTDLEPTSPCFNPFDAEPPAGERQVRYFLLMFLGMMQPGIKPKT